jgi:hypothetical protein
MIPGPQQSVLDSYSSDQPVDRVNRATLPEDARVEVVQSQPWVNHVAVETVDPFVLRLFLFQFPGWRAYIDGEEVPIEIARPEGFITVPVPGGVHDVRVEFGTTPARTIGWVLTAAGVLALVVLVVSTRTKGSPRARYSSHTQVGSPSEADPRPATVGATQSHVFAILGVIALTAALKAAVLEPAGWLTIASPEDQAIPATSDQGATFGDQIDLLGYTLSRTELSPGSELTLSLYWQARKSVANTYQSFVHLAYTEGQVLSQSDHLNPGGFPTDRWPTDRYVKDTHRLRIPANAPAGTYLLSVGLYTLWDNSRLPVEAADCGGRADSVVLCTPITIRR